MKYLLFNLLVVGALAFLLFDGEPPKTVRGAVNKVAAEADRLVAKGKALIRSANTESPARRTSPVTAMPQPVTTTQAGGSRDASVAVPPDIADTVTKPVPAASTLGTASPRPAKPRKVNEVPIRALDPAVASRRAEVLSEVPDGAVGAPAATAEFMASRVRRGELHKLAEDMELMFVEKAGR